VPKWLVGVEKEPRVGMMRRSRIPDSTLKNKHIIEAGWASEARQIYARRYNKGSSVSVVVHVVKVKK
jgi:hypothetical protein